MLVLVYTALAILTATLGVTAYQAHLWSLVVIWGAYAGLALMIVGVEVGQYRVRYRVRVVRSGKKGIL